MPTKPGIYIFKDASGRLLYIGKANRLVDRVRSYFAPPARLGPKTAVLVSQIATVDHIEVTSEVEALLLESRLIKKFRPPYNIAAKDDKSPYYIHLTRDLFPRPIVNHQPYNSLAGPFLSGFMAKNLLKQFRRVAPFCLAPRPVRRPCLYSHLGLCRPCPALGDREGYLKNISRLRRLLRGQFSRVASDLKKEMSDSAYAQQYEQASQARDSLRALDYLTQIRVSPEEYLTNPNLAADRRAAALSSLGQALHIPDPLSRIEFYDNAHLQGDSTTSALVVATAGDLTPSQYRHFTVKSAQTDSDVALMAEVLSRRFKHSDWPHPDLVVLDGGLPQLSAVPKISSLPPISALAKSAETLYFPDGRQLQLPLDHPGLLLLIHLRDEAHRFSRRLHHQHRSKVLK